MTGNSIYYTAEDLAARGKDRIPPELVAHTHLIYSSPATLAYNSPGAEGFGVKRAGLALPESVMLIVAPGCCGRNTSAISTLPGYENRFFYLIMDETDLVTGRHLKKIPQAVENICESLPVRPRAVMICITCVDALLGTDMERVCRKAEEKTGVLVRPCYMYALTREGRKPPMVHVRQSLYSVLEKKKKDPRAVNILGFFAPLSPACELRDLLYGMGVRKIREISACRTLDEFYEMGEANFNLVLNTEARAAALDMEKRLSIPSIELVRLYQVDQIHRQYQALARALGVSLDDSAYYEEARKAMKDFREKYPETVFAVGEAANANPFELSLSLVRYGFRVAEIYAAPAPEDYVYVRQLGALSPDTKIFSNLDPSMLFYRPDPSITMTIGKDAAWYHPDLPGVAWNADIQPFGHSGVRALFEALGRAMEEGGSGGFGSRIRLGGPVEKAALPAPLAEPALPAARGLRKVLTPFAPDQSGAVSVYYELGGITVICDAGGCAGNVCGFDEPRWFTKRSAVFSAGLRDMDAILGRDERLAEKLADAANALKPPFAAIVGTPVPAVIGTDFRALSRLSEKKAKIPVLYAETSGMALYDEGARAAWISLLDRFARKDAETKAGRIGVLGAIPLDLSCTDGMEKIRKALETEPGTEVLALGMGGTLEDLALASTCERNLAVSAAGLKVCRYLEERFGIPYTADCPLADSLVPEEVPEGGRILVVHQQVMAVSLRRRLLEKGAGRVVCASWFLSDTSLEEEGDLRFREEKDLKKAVREGGFDMIIGDACFLALVPDYAGTWIDAPHFAVSGRLVS